MGTEQGRDQLQSKGCGHETSPPSNRFHLRRSVPSFPSNPFAFLWHQWKGPGAIVCLCAPLHPPFR